ncbi:DUF4166 domain-containing protein [Mangrovibacillus cuniculi]|uniref:DUF4166 domain-containing protein n=1 Tax=Mangrovibacillus cuniculi TaxID=2593652 RepID=A0A7S8HEM5_9BACI|nr:DUF4166 domain-containing protein [Mangrovibacillus cuniculi]QPC45877.1 DUF4166 domain-containing protein [Mangrovibacillus cuniculi]
MIRQVLTEDQWDRLHEKVKRRYAGDSISGQGIMKVMKGAPKTIRPILPLGRKRNLLLSESGTNVPFDFTWKKVFLPNGMEAYRFERTFHFSTGSQSFNAVLVPSRIRPVIHDFLGDPATLYATITPTVREDGSLEFLSERSSLVMDKKRLSLPAFASAQVKVEEKYDDQKNLYIINVHASNSMVGDLFYYRGHFAERE